MTSIHISKMCVCSDEGKSMKFHVVPKKLGHIPITVKATTSQARLCPKATLYAVDAVTRTLLVEVADNKAIVFSIHICKD